MAAVATPIIRTLEKFYSPEKDESAEEREVADSMQQADMVVMANKPTSVFQVKSNPKSKPKLTTQVNFTAKVADLDRIKKHLRQPNMSKSNIGQYIFDYFLKSEGLK